MLFILAAQRQKGGFYMLYCSNKYLGSKTKLCMVLKMKYTPNTWPVNKEYPMGGKRAKRIHQWINTTQHNYRLLCFSARVQSRSLLKSLLISSGYILHLRERFLLWALSLPCLALHTLYMYFWEKVGTWKGLEQILGEVVGFLKFWVWPFTVSWILLGANPTDAHSWCSADPEWLWTTPLLPGPLLIFF